MRALRSSDYVRVDFVQATDDATLEQLFSNYVTSLVVENERRAKEGKTTWLGISDIGLSSIGDVFFVHFFVTDGSPGWESNELPKLHARFWMGGDAESLGDYSEAAIASLRTGASTVSNMTMGVIGGRTRAMAFIAGVKEP
jgi:hypothetical protein